MTHRNGIFQYLDELDEENQPLIPRRNPPVRMNYHSPYHGNCSEIIRDPIFWLFCSFAIAVILSFFLLIGAIWSWSPTIDKFESEGMYLFCIYKLQFSSYSLEHPKCQILVLLAANVLARLEAFTADLISM